MGVPEDPPKQKPKRWLKRLAALCALLLLIAVVFHKPLLRWVITYGGIKGAEIAGIELSWTVNGSVLGDLYLEDISAQGSLVDHAHVGKLAAEYDSWRFVKTQEIDIVKSITLKEVEAVVDLRKLPTAKPEEKKREVEASTQPPPLVWPKTIDIENINLDLTLGDGGKIVVRGLTLRVGEGMPGVFECAEFRQEPGTLQVKDLKANVAWEERKITISDLALPYGAKLQRLALDLTQFRQDAVSVGLEVALGKALAKVDARATGLFQPPLRAEAKVKVKDLASSDLTMVALPPGTEFAALNVDLHAQGPLNATAQGEIKVSGIRAAGVILDEITLPIRASQQKADIEPLRVVRGSNEIRVSAHANLPEDVAQWQKIAWSSQVQATLRDVRQLLEKPPPVQGEVVLTVEAQGLGATPRSAQGKLQGSDLGFESYRLPRLETQFALNGQEATFELPGLELGTGNKVSLNASMRMEDTLPVRAEWRVQVDDPAALLTTVNLPPLEQPVTAKLLLSGKASLSANDPLKADAELNLSIQDGEFHGAALPRIELQAKTAQGLATLKPLKVTVDERNYIDLQGTAKLAAPWTFDVDGDVSLPELKALNPLMKALQAPAIESGSLMTRLDLKGDGQPWRSQGSVQLTATKVKVASMPEAADALLQATFADTTAELQKLQANLGPWKLLTQGRVTDKEARLQELSIWQNDRQLLAGHANVPFDLTQPGKAEGQPMDVVLNAKELPVAEIAKAAGVKDVPPALLTTELKMAGRLDTADVMLKIGLRDAQAPGLPKSLQPANADVSVVLKNKMLELNLQATQPPLQPIKLKAELPLAVADVMQKPESLMDAPIKASLDQASSDLSFVREFAPELLKSIPAKMELHASISGTVKAPLIDSSLKLDAPEIGFINADMPSVRDVHLRLRTHDRQAFLEDISALLAGGRVKVGGNVDAADLKDPKFNIKVQAREALVFRNPTSSLRANADVTCAGSLKAARVSGLVEAVRGRVFQEVNLLPNVMGMIPQGEKLPPPPPSTSRSEQKLELPEIIKDWTFDLKVKTRDPVLIAGNLVNGAISADVALGGTGAKPRLTGGANVDRLLLKLPFSLLKITKGVVVMNPDNPFVPKLDVRGESRVGLYDITLYVYGDATDPKTRFTSSPPLSEADIVTLLGTGMTLGGDSSQMASEAATRAIFLVVTETYRKIFNKKKTVKEEPPKLHMTFNPSGGDRANDNVQAMYEITPKVRFTGRFMQSGRMKALLGYVLRFGKAARAADEEVAR